MSRKILLPGLLLPLLLAACGEPADTHPDKPVTHRRAAFNKILKPFEAMGGQLRQDRFAADKFLELAKQLDSSKEEPWTYFGPDTNYPPTRATAKVWSDAERFATSKQNFLQASSQLLAAAESRNEKQIRAAYEATHETCRNCHKIFKD